jgi:hypothetical protein
VLDASCATSVLVRALANAGCDAHGVDVSEWAVTHRVSDNVVRGSLLHLPHHSDTFGLIISRHVLEHICPDALPQVTSEQAESKPRRTRRATLPTLH